MNDEQQKPLYCSDLKQLGMWNTSKCCYSCHEDEYAYGFDFLDKTLPDGRRILVCCTCKPWDAITHEVLDLS